MKSFLFYCLLMTLLATCVLARSTAKQEEQDPKGNVKTLSYTDSVKEIVKDLIDSWNSPLVYLKKRGYLNPVFIALNMMHDEPEAKDPNKEIMRIARSFYEETSSTADLNNLFRNLFSSANDNSVSDKIKSKLGVAWDMDKLKTSVRNEAHKYYEKYYDKRNEQQSNRPVIEDIDKQVAQLYPSVIPSASSEHAEQEEHGKELPQPVTGSLATSPGEKDTKFLNGIAKLLTNRKAKPLALTRETPTA
ncbi:hypothetical protein KR222_001622 [Zaprionus bogoriensis]|nr:hypothetical protein KR222_001622 [Zaprionus bogoriensis]